MKTKLGIKRLLIMRMEKMYADYVMEKVYGNTKVDVDEEWLEKFVKVANMMDMTDTEIVDASEMDLDKNLTRQLNDAIKLIPHSITICERK